MAAQLSREPGHLFLERLAIVFDVHRIDITTGCQSVAMPSDFGPENYLGEAATSSNSPAPFSPRHAW